MKTKLIAVLTLVAGSLLTGSTLMAAPRAFVGPGPAYRYRHVPERRIRRPEYWRGFRGDRR
jgi:hypothetical protein